MFSISEKKGDEQNVTLTPEKAKALEKAVDTIISGSTIPAENGSEKKRTNKVNPLYSWMRKAKALQFKQLDQSGATKKACIEAILQREATLFPDPLRASLAFKEERDHLLDSKRFCAECESVGRKPEEVADHTIFEGKKIVKDVLQYGPLHVLGERINMFNCPLWEDTQKLYSVAQPPVAKIEEGANE